MKCPEELKALYMSELEQRRKEDLCGAHRPAVIRNEADQGRQGEPGPSGGIPQADPEPGLFRVQGEQPDCYHEDTGSDDG